MPAIWNVATANNINNKKLSSKVTFDVGEKFSGRIVKVGENNKEAMVKLLDGWQFLADVDGDVQEVSKGFIKFQVEGFENGKLKLKIIADKATSRNDSDDIIESFLDGEGLPKEDTSLILKMIKHNMPLSRENVLKMKSIINFQNKLMINPEEGNEFIEKYLLSKGFDRNSEAGKNISNTLKEFFQGFSSLNEEDIFMFVENNIDFTKQNIESYEKLFKGTGSLYKELKSMGSNIKQLFNSIDIEWEPCNVKEGNAKGESKIDKNINTKDSIAEGLKNTTKSLNGNEDITQIKMKEIEINKKEGVQGDAQNRDEKINFNYDKNTRADVLQNIYGGNNKINMLQLLKALTTNETDIIKYAFEDVLSKKPQLDNVSGKELLNKFVNWGDKAILAILKDSVEENGMGLKDLQKPHIEQALSKYFGKTIYLNENEFSKIDDTIKYLMKTNTIEEVAPMDNPKAVNVNQKDINKEQINDEFNKTTKSSNVVSENSIEKEGVQEGSKGKNVETRAEPNTIMNGKNIEENFNVKGKGIIEIKELTSQQVVKEQIKDKSHEIKTIIRDILNNVNGGDSQISEKIFSIIKNNINDFKMFNTISNEYYYMDLPLKIKEQDYPCKLMVKDNRKDGKRIDSTNVKMVVSVDTVNIGVVDGYLKVKDKNISIDMKCEETFVKPLNLGKIKLEKALKGLGYDAHIYVSKKVNEAELNNCREFFNDNNISAIDRKV